MKMYALVIFDIVFSLKITKKVGLFWKCNTIAKASASREYFVSNKKLQTLQLISSCHLRRRKFPPVQNVIKLFKVVIYEYLQEVSVCPWQGYPFYTNIGELGWSQP